MRPRTEEFQKQTARLFPEENGPGKYTRTVTVQVTDACNLRCSYCYQVDKRDHKISVETAKKFLDIILTNQHDYINLENTSGMILDFIGGEPFLAVDVMSELTRWTIMRLIELRHPWLHRFKVSISSNGTLYFDPAVQAYLKEFKSWISLSISLDGNKELHDACRLYPNGQGSYDQAVAAAKDWIAKEGNLGSKMTLAPSNVVSTSSALINLIELGYVSIFCNCVFEEGWTIDHARVLYLELIELTDWLERKGLLDDIYISIFEEDRFKPRSLSDDGNWCGGTGDMIAVDYKGDIFPCLRYMESSLGADAPPVIIGTVDGGIGQTQEQRDMIKLMKCVTCRSQCTDECYLCPIADGCSWCSAYNYQRFGSVNRKANYICEMHKARALANVYFWIRYNRHMGITTPVTNHVPREWAIPIIGQEEFDRLNGVVEDYKRDAGY